MMGGGEWMNATVRRALVGVLAVLAVAAVAVQAAVAQTVTPPPGSPLRTAILDALRPVVEAEVGPPVEFVIEQFNVLGEWAFVRARPQRKGGGAIPYTYSRYQAFVDAGSFSGRVTALLRQTPIGWLVYGYDLGAGHAVWVEWQGFFPVPPDVFEIK